MKLSKEELLEQLDNVILFFGTFNQKIIAIEELSELTKEITKDIRADSPTDVQHIAEEIADVEIVIEQLKRIYSVEELVEHYKVEKLKRLQTRIEQEMGK